MTPLTGLLFTVERVEESEAPCVRPLGDQPSQECMSAQYHDLSNIVVTLSDADSSPDAILINAHLGTDHPPLRDACTWLEVVVRLDASVTGSRRRCLLGRGHARSHSHSSAFVADPPPQQHRLPLQHGGRKLTGREPPVLYTTDSKHDSVRPLTVSRLFLAERAPASAYRAWSSI